MVERQLVCLVAGVAILASPSVAQENIKSGKGRCPLYRHIFFQDNYRRQFHFHSGGANNAPIFGKNGHSFTKNGLNSFLPRPCREWVVTERAVVGIENQSLTPVEGHNRIPCPT